MTAFFHQRGRISVTGGIASVAQSYVSSAAGGIHSSELGNPAGVGQVSVRQNPAASRVTSASADTVAKNMIDPDCHVDSECMSALPIGRNVARDVVDSA